MKRPETLPKLLPWLARQAGIDQGRAAALWNQARRRASEQTGASKCPAYWRAAMDEFRALLAQESLQRDIASLGMRTVARNHAKWLRAAAEAYERTAYLLCCWQRLPLRVFRSAAD